MQFSVSRDILCTPLRFWTPTGSHLTCKLCQYDDGGLLANYGFQMCDLDLSVVGVYLIFKSFDENNCPKPLDQLSAYGIIDPLLSWLHSFFNARTQCAKIDNYTSRGKPITSGVIQGGIIGPLLSAIESKYILEELFMFADDLKVVNSLNAAFFRTSKRKPIVTYLASNFAKMSLLVYFRSSWNRLSVAIIDEISICPLK